MLCVMQLNSGFWNWAANWWAMYRASFFHPNPPDVQITQYGEARRFNHLDSAKAALPDTHAYERFKESAEVN